MYLLLPRQLWMSIQTVLVGIYGQMFNNVKLGEKWKMPFFPHLSNLNPGLVDHLLRIISGPF